MQVDLTGKDLPHLPSDSNSDVLNRPDKHGLWGKVWYVAGWTPKDSVLEAREVTTRTQAAMTSRDEILCLRPLNTGQTQKH